MYLSVLFRVVCVDVCDVQCVVCGTDAAFQSVSVGWFLELLGTVVDLLLALCFAVSVRRRLYALTKSKSEWH